jgi:probable HAF family extracellular repeat protein
MFRRHLRTRFPLLGVLAVAVLVASSCIEARPFVRFGPSFAEPADVNNSGVVVGTALDGTNRAFRYESTTGALTYLGHLGGSHSGAEAVNDAGFVVGWSTVDVFSTHAFVYDPGTAAMEDLGTLGGWSSQAKDINSSGVIVGIADLPVGSGQHAFVYDPLVGEMQDIGTLGGDFSAATAISDTGLVVGYSTFGFETYDTHGFVYDLATGEMRDLGTLGGPNSMAEDVNDAGTIVGWSETGRQVPCQPQTDLCPEIHHFAYDTGTGVMTDLRALPGTTHSWAKGINEAGVVVGYGETMGHSHSVPRILDLAVWELGTPYIYSPNGSGSDNTTGQAINDHGLVAGVLWTPEGDDTDRALPSGFTQQLDHMPEAP